MDVVLNQALLGGDLENLIDLEETEALDVDGTALLVGFVIEVRIDGLNLFVLLEIECL